MNFTVDTRRAWWAFSAPTCAASNRRTSDLDVLAVFDSDASLLDLGGAQVMLSEPLGLKVDLIPREDVRPELKETIESEAVPV